MTLRVGSRTFISNGRQLQNVAGIDTETVNTFSEGVEGIVGKPGSSWRNRGSRSGNTSYQNTTGNHVLSVVTLQEANDDGVYISPNNSTWYKVLHAYWYRPVSSVSVAVPSGWYIKTTTSSSQIKSWYELY